MLCSLCGDGFTPTPDKRLDRICSPCWQSIPEPLDERNPWVTVEEWPPYCLDCRTALDVSDAVYAGPIPAHCPRCGESYSCTGGAVARFSDLARQPRIRYSIGFEQSPEVA